MEILEVYRPTTKIQDVAFSDYEIFTERELDPAAVAAAVNGPMMVMVHGKNGDKEKDISSQIVSVSVEGDKLSVRLTAGQGNFLNPENFIKGVLDKLGCDDCFYFVRRTACYKENGELYR